MDDYDGGDDAALIAAAAAAERTSSQRAHSGTIATGDRKVVQPKPQTLPQRQGPSAILVSPRQKGNPILNHVKSLPWEYSDIVCDYVLGLTTCALFLSLKYHRLHPEYIYSRIRALGKSYNLRILLTMVDIENHEEALKELSKTSMINNLTLVLCWSAQEAGRYLELFKSYEHASPASIRAHQATTYQESLTEFVTTPRNINKTDAASLISNFGSLRAAINAQPEELALVPGWGEKKVRAWYTTLREPFRVKRAAKTNIALLRQESSMIIGDDQRTPVSDRSNTPHQVIPLSSVPSQETGRSHPLRKDTAQERGNQEPPLDQSYTDDISDDGDLAYVEEYADDIPAAEPSTFSKSPSEARKEPELTEGVMAALAKLRKPD